MKPNLFIVGAPKCGTTAWYQYLSAHPHIFFPSLKEPHFFAADLPGFRRTRTEEEYLSLFADAAKASVRGEASVFYLYSDVAVSEIARFNPAAKLLIFVRPQENCLPSLHQQLLFTFDESIQSFEQAWNLSGKRSDEMVPETCQDKKILDYKAMGMFRQQIDRCLLYFPADQIRIIHFDDWIANPRDTYLKILEFLDVPDDGREVFPRINEARYHNSRMVARFLQHPPRWVLGPKNSLKKALGKTSLGVADLIAKKNRTRGYTEEVSASLQLTIKQYYAERDQIIAPAWGADFR